MRHSLEVARWELVQNLRNRQFILLTVLLPIIIIGVTVLAALIGTSSSHQAGGSASLQQLVQGLQSGNPDQVQTIVPMALGLSFSFVFIFVALFSGQLVLQNVVREKQSRVVELLLSAISPRELMAGKILGFGALGMVQAFLWVAIGLLLLLFIGPYLGLPVLPLLAVLLANMPWGMFALYLLYFVLGYLLIASLSAALGATMTDYLSGQQFQQVIITLPSMIPFFIISLLLQEPNGTVARVFSYLPLTSAGTMMMRLAVGAISPWEILASLLVLLLSSWLAIRVAGKVFEISILLYGKSVSLREIWRWARS
ncbi:MAG TPA: ABC transporter permease [Candidatus Fraserbacteria bacterium]|nr:ABC transporter permease [Candidatus Fraserbacteria bacterium]